MISKCGGAQASKTIRIKLLHVSEHHFIDLTVITTDCLANCIKDSPQFIPLYPPRNTYCFTFNNRIQYGAMQSGARHKLSRLQTILLIRQLCVSSIYTLSFESDDIYFGLIQLISFCFVFDIMCVCVKLSWHWAAFSAW